MKKTFVLTVLFVLPIVAYLFFASGITNFGKLPVLKNTVQEVTTLTPNVSLANKITILGFLGNQTQKRSTNVLNLNQKIYKRFYQFNDFQMVMLVPFGQEKAVENIKAELEKLTNLEQWHFVFATPEQIEEYYSTLNLPLKLEADFGTNLVFIVDKQLRLRGRDDDEEEGIKYGFDATSVAEINKKMVDDVKIILAEYRLALKKNNAARSK